MKRLLSLALVVPFSLSAKNIDTIASYEENYALGTYTDEIHPTAYDGTNIGSGLQQFEVKYQLSVSLPLYRFAGDVNLMGAYTQKSLWQLANSDISSPFRETNYKPQLFVVGQPNLGVVNHFEFGFKHESNGRSGTLTRSWDRIYFAAEKYAGPLEYGIHWWSVVGDTSENRDIEDYYASYKLWLKGYTSVGEFDVSGFHNFDSGRNGWQVGYTVYFNELIGMYLQAYHGYGETLIDYNHSQTRVGIGFKLINW